MDESGASADVIKWPDGEETWELDKHCNMSPNLTLLNIEQKGEIALLFTSLLWTNGDENHLSICFGTLFLMEKDHQDLMNGLTSESTFKIFNISKELPTVVKSLAVTFSVASLLSMYTDKDFTHFLQCVNGETLLNNQVMSKLQALRNVGVARAQWCGYIKDPSKMCSSHQAVYG